MKNISARQNYKNLLERYFGESACSFDATGVHSNDVIGALVHHNFDDFTRNYEARLERLAHACDDNPSLRPSILETLNVVADPYNWDGAYAELATLDFLFFQRSTAPNSVDLDITIPAQDTLASEMGYTNANLDGFLKKYKIYFDTKILSDKSGQILERIINEVIKKKLLSGLTILPSYNIDLPYDDFQTERQNLYKELYNKVDATTQLKHIRSSIIDTLSYSLAWKPGVIVGESTYNPNTHAENHHKLLFHHAKKYHRKLPCLIIFVHFPWSGEKLFPIDNSNQVFYKKMAQYFFEGYEAITDSAKQFNRHFYTSITAGDVANHLSGILFLEDKCILSKDDSESNILVYYYLNKNAKKSIVCSRFSVYLNRRGVNLAKICENHTEEC